MEEISGIDAAIDAAKGPAELARLCGESIQTVSNWRKRGAVSVGACCKVEAVTSIDRRRLRPHDWQRYWPIEAAADQPQGSNAQ